MAATSENALKTDGSLTTHCLAAEHTDALCLKNLVNQLEKLILAQHELLRFLRLNHTVTGEVSNPPLPCPSRADALKLLAAR